MTMSYDQPPVVNDPGMTNAPVGAEPSASPSRKRFGWLTETIVTVVLAILLYLVIQTFLVQTFRVEGRSMDITLHDGQHLLIDKLTPRFTSYGRGDVVVLHPPGLEESATPYIKRVIGVAGDHLAIHDGSVWIDGIQLEEPYVRPGAETEPETDQEAWDIGEGQVFVMGDNRPDSSDSRAFGVVRTDEIIGRAFLRFWPLDRLGLITAPSYPELATTP